MTPKQIFAFIVFLIVLLIIAVGISKLSGTDISTEVEVSENFGNKIVYTTNVELDPVPFQNDCRERGGEFNSCGNVCGPQAEVCAEVCAYTCENIGEENGSAEVPASWEIYTGTALDFEMRYPGEMDVAPVEHGGVNFSIWGPTQIEDSEFFDGISLTVREMGMPAEVTLREFVESKMSEEHVNPVAGSLREIVIDGRDSFQFVASGEINIPITYVYVPSSETAAFEITYTAPDPTNQDFQETVDMMLSTLDIHPEVEE